MRASKLSKMLPLSLSLGKSKEKLKSVQISDVKKIQMSVPTFQGLNILQIFDYMSNNSIFSHQNTQAFAHTRPAMSLGFKANYNFHYP